jgi:hypothetical protein
MSLDVFSGILFGLSHVAIRPTGRPNVAHSGIRIPQTV